MSYGRPSCNKYQPPEKQWLQAEQGKYHGTRSRSLPQPYAPLYKERSHNNYTLHTPSGQPDGVAQHYTSPFPGLRIGPACEAGLSAGMRRERVPPRIRKKRKKEDCLQFQLVRLKGPISQLLWPEDVFIPHSISTHHHIVSCDFRSFPLSLGTKCLFKTFHLQNVYALILSAITHLWPYYRQVCLVEPTKLLYMLKHSTVFSPLKVNDTRISTHLSQTKQFYVYYIHLHILQFIKLLTSD